MSSTSTTVPVIYKPTHHSKGSKSIHLRWPKIADIIPAVAHCCSKAAGTGTGTSIIPTNPRCSSPVTFCNGSQKFQMVTVDYTKWNSIAVHFSVEKSSQITEREMVSVLIKRFSTAYNCKEVGQHHATHAAECSPAGSQPAEGSGNSPSPPWTVWPAPSPPAVRLGPFPSVWTQNQAGTTDSCVR